MAEYIEIIIPVLVALLASIPGVLSYIGARKKDEASQAILERKTDYEGVDATGTLLESAMLLVDPLKRRIASLESEYELLKSKHDQLDIETKAVIESLRARLDRAERNNFILCEGVRRLAHQIRSLGASPVFDIDEDLCKEMNGFDE